MATLALDAPLVERHGWRVDLGAEPTAILWLGDRAAVTLGDGSVRWLGDDGEHMTVPAHGGAILAACRHPNGAGVVTGGDDGRVCRVAPDGHVVELGRVERRWVEHLVASPTSGAIVAGIGHEAVVWLKGATAPSHRFTFGSTIGGLVLDAKGRRLGVAHYNGATLVYVTTAESGRVALNWVGSHLACTLSPDGAYLVTALQETGLHGWRLAGPTDMAMSGYTAKTRSFAWDRRGRWLATGGDARAILWPFVGKTGPMGKAPLMLAERKGTLVTRVAFHPREEVLAIGYSDGAVVLARVADESVLPLDAARGEGSGGFVTTLAWNDRGTRLGWGSEGGRIGIVDMEMRA